MKIRAQVTSENAPSTHRLIATAGMEDVFIMLTSFILTSLLRPRIYRETGNWHRQSISSQLELDGDRGPAVDRRIASLGGRKGPSPHGAHGFLIQRTMATALLHFNHIGFAAREHMY